MNLAAITIFPDMFEAFWSHGIVRLAIERQLVHTRSIDLRDYASGRHRVTDDRPYGGGNGMVMKPEPLARAIRDVRDRLPGATTVLMTPQGATFNQSIAAQLAQSDGLIFICGRYEGVDERVCQKMVDCEISIGDYVLTGGELAAMVVMDSVVRLLPGALGGEASAQKESFVNGLLEHAHYTRPPIFEEEAVPAVLLSGNHAAIERWRHRDALVRTLLKRPDLLAERALQAEEVQILESWCDEVEKFIAAQSEHRPGSLSGDQ